MLACNVPVIHKLRPSVRLSMSDCLLVRLYICVSMYMCVGMEGKWVVKQAGGPLRSAETCTLETKGYLDSEHTKHEHISNNGNMRGGSHLTTPPHSRGPHSSQ